MPKGDPQTSPWTWQARDNNGNLIGIAVHRDAECALTRILIGLGESGTPDDTPTAITVPDGDTTLTAAQLADLAAAGLTTIEDVLALQITAGP